MIRPPPPGWRLGLPCGKKGVQAAQQRVQFSMLPWADPQALHEMERQGITRCGCAAHDAEAADKSIERNC